MDKVELVHKITIDVEKGVSLSDFIAELIAIDEEHPDMLVSQDFNFDITNTITEKVN